MIGLTARHDARCSRHGRRFISLQERQSSAGAGRVQRFQEFMKGFASVPSSRDLILRWAGVMVAARTNGRRIEAADAWIAATAPTLRPCTRLAPPVRLSFQERYRPFPNLRNSS